MNKIKNFDAIIYHGPCSDGTAGLWCACHYKPIKNRYSCKAGFNPINDYTGMSVIFVDLCPKIEYLLELVQKAKYVVILDHHKSSEQVILDNDTILSSISNLHIEFDMERSGCQMTWDYFFDLEPRPYFIDYIGDRDLWTFKLPYSKEINNALLDLNYIDSYNLNKLTDLLKLPEEKKKNLISSGIIIETINKKQLEIAIYNAIEAKMNYDKKIYRIWLGGNVNPTLRSELGNTLCLKTFKDEVFPDFCAIWFYNPKSDEWLISFRGIAERSPDLSVIASSFGGGGHVLASGIRIKSELGLKYIFTF